MNKPVALLIGAGIGATVMYFLDPERGTRRRALVRDQTVRARHKLQDGAQTLARDVRNRVRGTGAAARSRLQEDQPADDVLVERVRAVIGRVVSHPGAIEVAANSGTVTLSGPVLTDEVPLLIDRVLDVRGVQEVADRLQPHRDPGSISALQGASARNGGPRWEYFQGNWSPAARLAAGLTGSGAVAYGFSGGGILRKAGGIAGLALLARAATNKELRQLLRIGGRRRAITVQKTLRINAPVERVFEVWANPENFPQFMTHAREVRRLDDARWHWKVRGRSGLEFEFDSKIIAYEPNRSLAWRSEPGAWVQHTGSVRFLANRDGSTTVDVKMSYQPVAGAAGHVIAKLLGDDPKRQLDDDLMRMKSFMETGVRPHDAAAVEARSTH